MRRVAWFGLVLAVLAGGCNRPESGPQSSSGAAPPAAGEGASVEVGPSGAADQPNSDAAPGQAGKTAGSAESAAPDAALAGTGADSGASEPPSGSKTSKTESPAPAGHERAAPVKAGAPAGEDAEGGAPAAGEATGGHADDSAGQTPPDSASAEKEEPLLLLDDATPLLLDEGESSSESSGPMADNSRCHVCHLNFMEEELALTHAKANIGCADCHGDSDAHIADESWASGGNGTPPDRMFPKEKINAFCLTCHPKEKIAKKKQHKLVFAEDAKDVYCTDCHGEHQLDEWKCKWK